MADIWQALQSAGLIILSVVAPKTWRLTRLHVWDSAYAPTAFTDGVNVVLPHTFSGVEVEGDLPLAVGLLTHELSHFLQPLKAINQVMAETRLDHDVVNIALDIQGEALMAAVFPLNAEALEHTRATVWAAHEKDYRERLAKATDLAAAWGPAAMIGRYSDSTVSWNNSALMGGCKKLYRRVDELLAALAEFAGRKAGDLPGALRRLADQFPELCQKPPDQEQPGAEEQPGQSGTDQGESGTGVGEPEDSETTGGGAGADEEEETEEEQTGAGAGDEDEEEPAEEEEPTGSGQAGDEEEEAEAAEATPGNGSAEDGGNGELRAPSVTTDDLAAEAVQAEAQDNLGYGIPKVTLPLGQQVFRPRPLPLKDQQVARSLRVRFKAERGAFDIQAPGRPIRRLMGQGDPMPYRMQIPGRETPAPNVVLWLDVSGSMDSGWPRKIDMANQAARILATGIEKSGGKVVGLLFGERGRGALDWGAAPLLANPPADDLDTDFKFLSEAWRRWEGYWFLGLTDGGGDLPVYISPADKARTSVLVIPSGDVDKMRQLAGHVEVLDDIRRLPQLLPLLIPFAMR